MTKLYITQLLTKLVNKGPSRASFKKKKFQDITAFQAEKSTYCIVGRVALCEKVRMQHACYMHLTDNNMRKATCMLNECCNRFLHSCNMHVSCNMRGFGTFNKHVTCMLQASNMHDPSM